VAGPLARTVEDCALAMAVLAQPDARDTMALPAQALDWAGAVARPEDGPGRLCSGLRVGLWLDPGWGLAPEPAPLAAARAAAEALAREGAQVAEVPAFMTRAMADGLNDFWRTRAWIDMQALAPAARSRLLPYIAAWAEAGGRFSGEHVFRAFSQIGATREAAVAACAPFDVVLSPVCPVAAPPAHWPSPTNDPLRAMEHIAYTVPFNMSEQPALALPWTLDTAGMPVGVQIAGPRHGDLAVLRVARVLELLRGPLPASGL
jgi:Asp-tRNA(Asn)/Glu-tRNA(Gln) amidotransferase A subunit family amidase